MQSLTRFELARLLSARALQISLGAPPLIKGAKNMSIFETAKLEFEKRILPLIVLREYPSGEIKKVELI